jgi:hypothetical protein
MRFQFRGGVAGSVTRWENPGHCPDCGCDELEDGRRGGLAVNRHCVNCGAWWNTMLEVGLIQRIRENEPKQPGRRITAAEARAWAWLQIAKPDLVEHWRLAPLALNYTEAEAWAKRAGYGPVLFLSSGAKLVQIAPPIDDPEEIWRRMREGEMVTHCQLAGLRLYPSLRPVTDQAAEAFRRAHGQPEGADRSPSGFPSESQAKGRSNGDTATAARL